jgi:hypothetical protein
VASAARDPQLRARVVARRHLRYLGGADAALDRPAHVRSASGLARWRGRLAVVSDDANFVGLLDEASGDWRPITLAAGAGGRRQFDELRGNKAHKLDLESVFVDDDRLIALGSDSGLAVRRHAVIVDDGGARTIALPRLYAALRSPLVGRGALNLEGATVLGDDVILGNRGGDVGDDGLPTRDAIVRLPRAALRALLADPDGAPLPAIEWRPLALGAIGGVALRLTELATCGGRLLYAATAEATTSAYDDGAVAGSAIGVIDEAGELPGGRGELATRWAPIVDEDGAPLLAKVEGLLAAEDGEDHGAADGDDDGDRAAYRARLLASIDADDPHAASELLTIELGGPW